MTDVTTVRRPRIDPGTALTAVWLVAWAILAYPALRTPPIWDGWQFFHNCQLGWDADPALRCYGHSAAFYNVLFGVIQELAGPSLFISVALNLVIAGFGIAAVDALLVRGFGEALSRPARLSLSVLWLLNPIMTAQVAEPGLDLLLAALTPWLFVSLVDRRWIRAAVIGLLMEATKETGVMLYGALLGIALVEWVSAERWRPRLPALRTLVLRGLLLAAPLLGFAYYMHRFPPHADAGGSWSSVVHEILLGKVWTPFARGQATGLFVLNFSWVMTLTAIVGWVIRRVRPRTGDAPVRRRVRVIAWLALLACFAVQSRVVAFGNVRYVLPLSVFLIIVAADGVLAVERRAATGWAAVLCVLALSSLWLTLDPVSCALQGTFAMGDRTLLDMALATKDSNCCGYGRDQLVYNLQFTELLALDERAVQRFGTKMTYVVPGRIGWFKYSDLKTFRNPEHPVRTIGADRKAFVVQMVDVNGLVNDPSDEAVYLEFPTAAQPSDLARLQRMYAHQEDSTVTDGAYAIAVHHFSGRYPAARHPASGAHAPRSGDVKSARLQQP